MSTSGLLVPVAEPGVTRLLRADPLGSRQTPLLLVLSSALFGVVVGSHSLNPVQMLYAGLKLPVLLALSTALCIPGVLAISAVLGEARAGVELGRHVLASQAVVAVTMASLAPALALVYLSTADYNSAKLASASCMGLAALVGHVDLRRRTRALRQTLVTIRTATRMWTLLYALVGIQLAWLLRPFVGNPGLPTTFFREDTWGNAYLHLLRVLGRVLGL